MLGLSFCLHNLTPLGTIKELDFPLILCYTYVTIQSSPPKIGTADMTTLYNLRGVAPGHYAIAKFDSDFNVAAVYNLVHKGAGYTCDCPASQRSVKTKPCKHQRMLPYMLGAVNTDRFFDPERGEWRQPLPPELSQAAYNGMPEGVTAVALDEPAVLHNTIAVAVGEPPAPSSASPMTQATPRVAPTPPAASNLVTRRI